MSEYIAVNVTTTDQILAHLVANTTGPAEAYAVLVTCIHRLNFEFTETPGTIDELIAEVALSLRSISKIQKAN